MELCTKNQSPLYEEIHEENNTSTLALPPCDRRRTNVYVPNTAFATSSGGAEGDGKCDISRDEVSGVTRRNAGQNEEVTALEGVTVGAKGSDEKQYEAVLSN